MKYVLMALLVLASLPLMAGDRIGNGGGIWACRRPTGEIESAELVDLFEAREELGWPQATPPTSDPYEIVRSYEARAAVEFPGYSSAWSKSLQTVQQNTRFVNADLSTIDDGLFRVRPSRSTCGYGEWSYVQFANFTLLGHIDISNEIWNSQRLAPVSKAALLWHEAIYYWLRTSFNDKDSVRARYITGLIFSEVPAAEKMAKLNALLQSSPQPPTQDWFCSLSPDGENRPQPGYGAKLSEAQTNAVKACQATARSPMACRTEEAECENISIASHYTCQTKNAMSGLLFTSGGRGLIEAKYFTSQACFAGSIGKEFFCNGYDIQCEAD